MKFKTDNSFLFVEGIQFINGEYETIDEKEIKILKRYADSISVVEEIQEVKQAEETTETLEIKVDETKIEEVPLATTTKKTKVKSEE